MNNKDLALAGLAVLTYFHNLSVNEAQIKHQFDTNGTGLTKTNWLLAAKSLGLKAKVVRKSVERLPFVHLPAMVWRDDGHHFILAQLDEEGGHHFFACDVAIQRLAEPSRFSLSALLCHLVGNH